MSKAMLLIGTLLLGACTNQKPRMRTADVDQFILDEGLESVHRIQQFKFWGWQHITDRYLVLSSSQKRYHLIKLMSPCTNLAFTQEIGLKQQFNTILNAKFDAVLVPGQFQERCTIDRIYPISKAQREQLSDRNFIRGQAQISNDGI